MTLVLIIIFLTAVLGIAAGLTFYVPGASRIPPRPRPKAPPPAGNVKEPKKSKKYI